MRLEIDRAWPRSERHGHDPIAAKLLGAVELLVGAPHDGFVIILALIFRYPERGAEGIEILPATAIA